MTKILFIGSDSKGSLELIFKQEFLSYGYVVDIFPSQSLFLDFYCKNVTNKILYRLGVSSVVKQIQSKIKHFINEINPSIVLVFKGMEVTPKTLWWIKMKGIKIYNFNPDHPFIFSGRGSGNRNVSKSIFLYDTYFSYASDVIFELNKRGINSYKIPFGFDSNGFLYRSLNKQDEVVKLCFLGNADSYRVKFINQLAFFGLEIDVFGENWHHFRLHSKVCIGAAKYGTNFWHTLQVYAVQLNMLRPHNVDSHNMRSFDIPGAGGIMLAPITSDHLVYFERSKEVFLYKDVRDAFNLAREVLGYTFEQRLLIRENARKRALKDHTYQNRVGQILSFVNV
jgi:spore maturation protein CgeB